MSAESEREALLKAFGVSNGTQVWVEFQGGPDELLATLHSLGYTRQSRAEIQAEALEGFIATVHAAYRKRFREFEEASLDAEASEVQRGRAFGRMDALAGLLSTLRGQRIREGGE